MEEAKDINVHFAGYVLAGILSDATVTNGTKNGLLYGEWSLDSIEDINDMEQDGYKETVEVMVQDYFQCERTFAFYDQTGVVCEEKLKSLNNARERQCIGFYSIRRDTKLSLSVREKTIIQNLIKSSVFHHKKLLFFLVVPTKEESKSTYNIQYKSFLSTTNRGYVALKTDIINLGQNEPNVYKHKSLLLPKKDSSSRNVALLQDYTRDKFVTDTGSVTLADNSYSMFNKTLTLLNNLQGELINCNEEIEVIQQEILLAQWNG